MANSELWIGWRQRWDGPPEIEIAAIARLEKLTPGALGYVEVPASRNRKGLFSRAEIYGTVRWTLDFVRIDGEIPGRAVYSYLPAALAAIYSVAALGHSKEAALARRALDADAAATQRDIFDVAA